VRCGNPLRRRVADAEWRFRRGTVAPIPEYALAEAANEVLTNAGAPSWARASVGELHLFRTAGRPELPRFIGTVESELRLSDRMSPVEAVFIAATLGKAMIHEPEEFRDGPETYLERIRERQRNPPPSPRLVVRIAPFDLTNDL